MGRPRGIQATILLALLMGVSFLASPVQARRRRPPSGLLLVEQETRTTTVDELREGDATTDYRRGLVELPTEPTKTTRVEPDATYSMEFDPDVVTVGDTTNLKFELTNTGDETFVLSSFTLILNQDLPPGARVTAADSSATSTCGATIILAGNNLIFIGSAFTFSPGDSCVITVPLVSDAVLQPYSPETSNILLQTTVSTIVLPPISAPLFVVDTLPTLEIEYFPSHIPEAGRISIRTYTIDNRNVITDSTNLNFDDTLPASVSVQDIISNSCGGILSALPSSNQVTFTGGFVAASSICDIEVSVTTTATATDTAGLVLGTNKGDAAASNQATLTIDSPRPPGIFFENLSPRKIAPGSFSLLVYTIQNFGSIVPVTDVGFSTDPLPSDLTFATPPVTDCFEGTVTTSGDGKTLTLSGAQLGGLRGCTVSVKVTGVNIGKWTWTTGVLSSSAGTGGTATAVLQIEVPTTQRTLSMAFSPDTVSYGATSRLTYTINQAFSFLLSFNHRLSDGMKVANFPNLEIDCPLASISNRQAPINPSPGASDVSALFQFTGNECTISYDVVANFIGDRTTCFDGEGGFICATLTGTSNALNAGSSGALSIVKEIIDYPAIPGSEVILRYRIIHDTQEGNDVNNISFNEDISALTGLQAAIDIGSLSSCGPDAMVTLNGDTFTFSGGFLSGQFCGDNSCTFDVTLSIPGTAVPGTYNLTTSSIDSSLTSTTESVITPLIVTLPPMVTTTFVNPTLEPGDVATLQVTIENTNPDSAATTIFWNSGTGLALTLGYSTIAAATLPTTPCGPDSLLSSLDDNNSNRLFTLFRGDLGAGESCTFEIDFEIPSSTSPGALTFSDLEVGSFFATVGTAGFSADTEVLPPLEIIDNGDPFDINAILVGGAECGSSETNSAVVDLLGESPDVRVGADSFEWTGAFSEGGGVLNGDAVSVTLPLGTSTLSLSADGTSITDAVSVNVELNLPPVANAGPNQNFFSTSTPQNIALDGSASSDPENGPLQFRWTIGLLDIAGEVITIQASVGVTVATLTVTDECGNSSTDTVTILITSDESNMPSLSPSANPSESMSPSNTPTISIAPSSLPSEGPSVSSAPSLSSAPSRKTKAPKMSKKESTKNPLRKTKSPSGKGTKSPNGKGTKSPSGKKS